jgi:flagellar protein FlbD
VIPIRLLNGSRLYINAELVESVAGTPDTVITLTTGRKIVASTRPEAILEAVLDYRRRVHGSTAGAFGVADAAHGAPAATAGRAPLSLQSVPASGGAGG